MHIKNSKFKLALISGSISGLLVVFIWIVLGYLNIPTNFDAEDKYNLGQYINASFIFEGTSSGLVLGLMAITISLSYWYYRRHNLEKFSDGYIELLQFGALTAFFMSLIPAGYNFIYYKWLNPNMFVERLGSNPHFIQEMMFSPLSMCIFTIIFLTIWGLIIASFWCMVDKGKLLVEG